jgi:adenosylhomocysteine nucleosidase
MMVGEASPQAFTAVVLISAGTEWRLVRSLFPAAEPSVTPHGEWFATTLPAAQAAIPVVFMHGGWGKIAAAASTQYAIDRWQPDLLVNLGTCGGFAGLMESGEVILAERTVVYDILEQMGDPDEALAHFATDIDLTWLSGEYPAPVRRTLMVSADRDLVVSEIPELVNRFGAVAGDWESGAIAWVAARHGLPCLILRGVTDLVGNQGGEAYDGNVSLWHTATDQVMRSLVEQLPLWLDRAAIWHQAQAYRA